MSGAVFPKLYPRIAIYYYDLYIYKSLCKCSQINYFTSNVMWKMRCNVCPMFKIRRKQIIVVILKKTIRKPGTKIVTKIWSKLAGLYGFQLSVSLCELKLHTPKLIILKLYNRCILRLEPL